MRRKVTEQGYSLPYFVSNQARNICEPVANAGDVETAKETIENYLRMDLSNSYVRPLHILICGSNPRAVKVIVEAITDWPGELVFRGDYSSVDGDLGDLLQRHKIIVLDLMNERFNFECPYMLGKRGVLIWMMPPGEDADKLEADFRIDVQELSVAEKRNRLKGATNLPFFVIDQLLSIEKDVWQIEETLQLIKPWPYEPEDLDFIGRLFKVNLSEFDWIEDDEDKEYDAKERESDGDFRDD